MVTETILLSHCHHASIRGALDYLRERVFLRYAHGGMGDGGWGKGDEGGDSARLYRSRTKENKLDGSSHEERDPSAFGTRMERYDCLALSA